MRDKKPFIFKIWIIELQRYVEGVFCHHEFDQKFLGLRSVKKELAIWRSIRPDLTFKLKIVR